MCLIAYVKAGSRLPESHLREAAKDNSDGIGIMSKDGIERYLGRKMVKRAWRRVRRLHDANAEFAIHFRYATHGTVSLANCHPFETPNGEAYIMHNGVIPMFTPIGDKSKAVASDTQLFVNSLVSADFNNAEYWQRIAAQIGSYNKLCVMSWDGRFMIVNEDSGDWIAGVWYSQTYSLPGYGYTTGTDVGWTWADKGAGDDDYPQAGYGGIVERALERRYGAAPSSWRDEVTEADESEQLDKALADHLKEQQTQEGTHICPSCEYIGMDAHCMQCGFIDREDYEQINEGWANNSKRLSA